MKRISCCLCALFLALTLMAFQEQHLYMILDGGLILPTNKVWAHRVNDTLTAQIKSQQFLGMELDIIYSPTQNQLFVCHDEEDTINGLTLSQYFSAIDSVENYCFWLDIKNLTSITADTISTLVKMDLDEYCLVDRAFLENADSWALQKAKNHGLHTSLWVDNFYWTAIDTASWYEKVNNQILTANPDGLSCEYHMFGALTECFPDNNIFLWHTPAALTPENEELTRTFCQHPSVKIVLVDYDEPIPYNDSISMDSLGFIR